MKTKQVGEHVRDCIAVQYWRNGKWRTPWCCGEHVFLNCAGNATRRGTTWSWLRFRCNNHECSATFLVRSVDVLVAAHGPRGEGGAG